VTIKSTLNLQGLIFRIFFFAGNYMCQVTEHGSRRSCTELYRVVQSCTELYRVVVQSCTELYRVVESCTEL
jgi:hypothetical protein